MRKMKHLALVLVVAIMMMGAGYAAWTETLQITNTVKAGDLNVIFKEPANITGESKYQPNADCSVTYNGAGMAVKILEVYPGLKNTFEFTLQNKGTLGAYVDNFAVNSTWGQDITNQILCPRVVVEGYADNYTGNSLRDAMEYLNNLNDGDGIFVDTTLVENGTQYEYTPGELLVTLDIEFDKQATKTTLPEKGQFGFNIDANVYQFNVR